MDYRLLLLVMQLQGPPAPEGPQPAVAPAPAPVDDGVALARYFEAERQYADRLGVELGQDMSRYWDDYQGDEKDRAEDRADGDDDDDSRVQSFARFIDDRYRRRLKLGGTLLGVGFAPLGVGLYIGLTLGEGGDVALVMAGIGGAAIVTGAVLLGVRGSQLRRLREIQAGLALRPGARLRWRGIGPLHDPQLRSYGASLGFAF
ncbi:hypothetical protein [Nannocystis bainbridge]|uniref:Uncharacterized protein n=1 Tax=Nannocystis bainbridge TaxID=2995303 RepID=A0ABT5EC46_9BACT|nr:hypothetical protein [Nannocystis bainbridge]MDC0723150.1 hypothetical protein [Nannocystis bainbridge]